MRDLYRYSLKGRSLSVPSRIIRLTVTAANADDARTMARMRCSDFGSTVESPKRRGRVIPEVPDPIDQWKAYVESQRATVEVEVA